MSKTSSTSSGETKQDDTQLHYLGTKLIPPATTKEEFTPTDLGRWTAIFSYLHFNEYERLSVRNLCRLFHTVLPGPTCAGVYTMYPHPNHASLNSLMNSLNEIHRLKHTRDHSTIFPTLLHPSWVSNVPEYLFLANGVHKIETEEHGFGQVNMVMINIPISIIGESREHCVVIGGLRMNGKQEDDVNVSDLTLRDSKGNGVWGYNGASIHLDNVSVENSEWSGVVVGGTKRNTMKNCNVSHSKYDGLFVESVHGVHGVGLMMIDGNGTTIHHNCTIYGCCYGLNTGSLFSHGSIHLASSLTIETISKNNGGGGNYGGRGTIKTITNNTKEEKKRNESE